MKQTHVFHLSDLHFSGPTPAHPRSVLCKSLKALIRKVKSDKVLLVCTGDLTFQGSSSGLRLAREFLQEVAEAGAVNRANIIICPGNHDLALTDEEPLESFDAQSYTLRGDSMMQFSEAHTSAISVHDVHLLVLNSSCRLDHRYGFVDVEHANEAAKVFSDKPARDWRIALLHHNPLGVYEHDSSSLRNAYPLLKFLDNSFFSLVLHGHQHFAIDFPIGVHRMRLFGVRTMNFGQIGTLNGFNHYVLDADYMEYESYIYVPDIFVDGKMGGYKVLYQETVRRE